MSLPLDRIIEVNISIADALLNKAGFGVPMIAALDAPFDERIKFFSEVSELTTAGFASTSETVALATILKSQPTSPSTFAVGRRANLPTDVREIEILTATIGASYIAKLNGVDFEAVGGAAPTPSTIATALADLLDADAAVGAVAVLGVITVTAAVAGVPFSLSLTDSATPSTRRSSLMSLADATVDVDLSADLTAIEAASSAWYGLLLTTKTVVDAIDAAAWIETRRKLFAGACSDSDIASSATSDLVSTLKALSYKRTLLQFDPLAGQHEDAALFGVMLPKTPGSATWAYQTLTGVAYADLSTDDYTNLEGKNAGMYVEMAGVGVTREGKAVGGRYMDITRGADKLQARIEENIATLFVSAEKVEYTDAGIQMIGAAIFAALQESVADGYLASQPEPTVTLPLAADVSSADRTARLLSGVKFTAQTAGAIHEAIPIAGTITA